MHIRRPEDESFGDEDNSNLCGSRTELSESRNETAQNSAVGFWKGLRATRREAPGRFWRWGVAAGSREGGVGEGGRLSPVYQKFFQGGIREQFRATWKIEIGTINKIEGYRHNISLKKKCHIFLIIKYKKVLIKAVLCRQPKPLCSVPVN